MKDQLPGALWVASVAAPVVVGVMVSFVFRRHPAVVAVLAIWFAVDVVLAALGEFAATAKNYVPLIAPGIALPLIAGIALLSRLPEDVGPSTLIRVQVYRAVGGIFLVAWLMGRLPGAFALPAGIGDVLVGLSAPLVASRADRSPTAALAWNVAGIVDLVIAVALGFFTSPSPLEQLAFGHPNTLISRMPLVLIPVFAVPLSLILHFATLRRVPASSSAARPPRRAPACPAGMDATTLAL